VTDTRGSVMIRVSGLAENLFLEWAPPWFINPGVRPPVVREQPAGL